MCGSPVVGCRRERDGLRTRRTSRALMCAGRCIDVGGYLPGFWICIQPPCGASPDAAQPPAMPASLPTPTVFIHKRQHAEGESGAEHCLCTSIPSRPLRLLQQHPMYVFLQNVAQSPSHRRRRAVALSVRLVECIALHKPSPPSPLPPSSFHAA